LEEWNIGMVECWARGSVGAWERGSVACIFLFSIVFIYWRAEWRKSSPTLRAICLTREGMPISRNLGTLATIETKKWRIDAKNGQGSPTGIAVVIDRSPAQGGVSNGEIIPKLQLQNCRSLADHIFCGFGNARR